MLGCNMFAYCLNNPAGLYDETGDLAFPGEIHQAVLNDIISKSIENGDSLEKEKKNLYKIGYGRADLIRKTTGEVWELKPNNKRQINKGRKQVSKYVENRMKDDPTLELRLGDQTISGSFDYQSGIDTYKVEYWSIEPGLSVYDYTLVKTEWETVAATIGGLVMTIGLLGIAIYTGDFGLIPNPSY